MKKYIFLSIVTLTLISCTKNQITEQVKISNDYFPMQVGNVWNYKVTNSQDNTSYIETTKVVSDTIIDGKKAYKFVTTNTLKNLETIKYYSIINNEIRQYGTNNSNFITQFITPYTVGTSWIIFPQSPTYKKEIKNETIFTWQNNQFPAFTSFRGVEVHAGDNGQSNVQEIIVPYIGIVNITNTMGVYGVIHRTTYELTSFNIK